MHPSHPKPLTHSFNPYSLSTFPLKMRQWFGQSHLSIRNICNASLWLVMPCFLRLVILQSQYRRDRNEIKIFLMLRSFFYGTLCIYFGLPNYPDYFFSPSRPNELLLIIQMKTRYNPIGLECYFGRIWVILSRSWPFLGFSKYPSDAWFHAVSSLGLVRYESYIQLFSGKTFQTNSI